MFFHAYSEDSDQTGQMPSLIRVFARRTGIFVGFVMLWLKFKLDYDKANKMTYAAIKDSDQPGYPPSLIRVFAVHLKTTLSRFGSLGTHKAHSEALADLSLP